MLLTGKELNDAKNYFNGNEDKDGPAEYYYENKLLGDSTNKSNNKGKKGGKIKSVIVKGDLKETNQKKE